MEKLSFFVTTWKIKIPHHLWIILLWCDLVDGCDGKIDAGLSLWPSLCQTYKLKFHLQKYICIRGSLLWKSSKMIKMRLIPQFHVHLIPSSKCKKLHQIDIFPCYVVSHKVRYDQTQKCIKAAKKVTESHQQKTWKLSSFVIDL